MNSCEVMWDIKGSSRAELRGLDTTLLKSSILSIGDLEILQMRKEFYDRTRLEYQGTSAEEYVNFQMNKSEDIERCFIEGLRVSFSDDEVLVETEFCMLFPDDWDKQDIRMWVEGFNRLTIAYLELSMSRIVKNVGYNDNKCILEILKDIERLQVWDIKRRL